MREPTFEEQQDVLEEGDHTIEVSAARAALGSRDFRTVWLGGFASNIGTWMQNVVLGAYAYELTRSPTFVSAITLAQLGPMLVLSVVGGLLADTFDRRRMLLATQAMQLVAAVALTVVVAADHDDANRTAIIGLVLFGGVFNALNAPAWVALLPSLVAREHLSGAISLNSTQMNASRVIGPAIAGVLFSAFGAAVVFGINAATYLCAIAGIWLVRTPQRPPASSGPQGLRRLTEGFAVARRDPFIRRILVTLVAFSFLSLPFIGQMPTLAAENLGIRPRSLAYGLLYASFGLGAVTGAVSIGTFLSGRDKHRIVRFGLAAFAVCLATFGLVRDPAPAYPLAAMVGFTYFATVTSLNTVLQEHLDDAVRGRVMSLWLMGFGGTVPFGLMAAGPVAEATSITVVLLYGAVTAAFLAWYADLSKARSAA